MRFPTRHVFLSTTTTNSTHKTECKNEDDVQLVTRIYATHINRPTLIDVYLTKTSDSQETVA